METLSVWRGTAAPSGYAMLGGDVQCDVLIIGGGITGVTLANLLAEQKTPNKPKVVLLEADEIGCGTTGNSTGNLYETVSGGMVEIVSRWGADVARQVAAERRAAMQFIEERCSVLPDVGFRKCPVMQWGDASTKDQIEKEFEALRAAGLDVRRGDSVPAPLPPVDGSSVIVLPDQAQFQPQAYVVALARRAAEAGASIHEHSRVIELDTKARRAVTATGSVTAREIVMATHTPKGIFMVHAEMPVHREYAIAFESEDGAPGPGAFWWSASEHLSVRTLEAGGKHYVVCAGEEHKVGVHNATAGLLAVENRARRFFGERTITHRWSAQNYRGADALPYIGRAGGDIFIATGFATDGLTWGTVAARLIAAELLGHQAAFADVVKPTRLSPVKGARHMAEEGVFVVKQLVKDYLTGRQNEKLASLSPGDSAIVEAEGETFAAYRAPDGELFAVSNVCPHMGCKVHWNSVETTWDCPCHGSRFRPDGTVVEGPALHGLRRKHVPALGSDDSAAS